MQLFRGQMSLCGVSWQTRTAGGSEAFGWLVWTDHLEFRPFLSIQTTKNEAGGIGRMDCRLDESVVVIFFWKLAALDSKIKWLERTKSVAPNWQPDVCWFLLTLNIDWISSFCGKKSAIYQVRWKAAQIDALLEMVWSLRWRLFVVTKLSDGQIPKRLYKWWEFYDLFVNTSQQKTHVFSNLGMAWWSIQRILPFYP